MSSDQSTGTDDWMGTDTIEFRSQGAGVHERVIVTINGTKLTDLWVAAKQQPTDPLPTAEVGTGLAAWSEYGELASSYRCPRRT